MGNIYSKYAVVILKQKRKKTLHWGKNMRKLRIIIRIV